MPRWSKHTFRSNKGAMEAFFIKAATDMVRAATIVVWRRAKMNARGGFKSGRFATTGWNSVRYAVKKGLRPVGQVGSTLEHFRHWEVGHYNIYTRDYERNRWLSKAFIQTKSEQRAAAQAAVRKTVGTAPAVLRKSFIATVTGQSIK